MEQDGVDGVKNFVGQDLDAILAVASDAVHNSLQLLVQVTFLPTAYIDTILHEEDIGFRGLFA